MSNRDTNAGGGVGLSTVLFLIFLVLKLCKVIDWSWWWVTAPLWISAIIVVLLFTGLFIHYHLEETKEERYLKKRRKKNDKN